MAEKALVAKPMEKLKLALSAESVQQQFRNALKDESNLFIASIISLVSSDPNLQQCEPSMLILECLKIAELKLPLSKQLGQAWIVPYKVKGVMTPQFQIGYKGLNQLAIRTGEYNILNADAVYEGETVKRDRIRGTIDILGEPVSDKAIGYFAHFELRNGFAKSLYMTKEEVIEHAKKYSKSYGYDHSAWATDFDSMAIKTPFRLLLSRWGLLSIEMQRAIESDEKGSEADFEKERAANANQNIIEIDTDEVPPAGTDQKKEAGQSQAGEPQQGVGGLSW